MGNNYVPFVVFPAYGVCEFLKNVYKKYFFENIRKYSNLPHYDQCPLQKNHYFVKDYPMDANTFRRLTQPGDYRLEVTLVENNKVLAGITFYVSVGHEKKNN